MLVDISFGHFPDQIMLKSLAEIEKSIEEKQVGCAPLSDVD